MVIWTNAWCNCCLLWTPVCNKRSSYVCCCRVGVAMSKEYRQSKGTVARFYVVCSMVAFLLSMPIGAAVGFLACGGYWWQMPAARLVMIVLSALFSVWIAFRSSLRKGVLLWIVMSLSVILGLWIGEGITWVFIYPDGPSSVPDALQRFTTWFQYGPC